MSSRRERVVLEAGEYVIPAHTCRGLIDYNRLAAQLNDALRKNPPRELGEGGDQ